MQHVLSTPNRGVIMQPDTDWDRNEGFLFTVDGMSDSGDLNCGNAVGVYKCS